MIKKSFIAIIIITFIFFTKIAFGAEKAKEFLLVAKEISWDILPGVDVNALTFNGKIPGPEIRVREGERVRIIVRNELREPTAIHWHGLEVPYDMDGVPGITQQSIMPGEEYIYEFVARPKGVRFYHSHANEAVQMTNAMHGTFIIEPAWDDKNKPDRHYVMFLTEWMKNGKGEVAMAEMAFNYFTINGKSFPATENLLIKKGEKIRITLINMGSLIHPMHLHGHQFKIVAKDGNEIAKNIQETRNVVPVLPGESYDIEFIANNSGVWTFHCHEPHHVENDGVEPGGLISLIVYEGYEEIASRAKQFLPVEREKMDEMTPMKH